MKTNPFKNPDWTSESLQEMWKIIRKVAKEEFQLDFYEPYFEIVTFEDILKIYATGFPVMYSHWSFGKEYDKSYKKYRHNQQSIAYEVIFNTNPALCYILETNTTTMQALVMSHAAVGHSAFFKTNSFIKENTDADNIINFAINFRDYVKQCEVDYGSKRVEIILDVCSSLTMYSIDRAAVNNPSKKDIIERKIRRAEEQEKDFSLIVNMVDDHKDKVKDSNSNRLKEENILKYVANYSPSLKNWERELIKMYCKMQQYFYPNRYTKMMNEGYASFWHYQLMHKLYDLGYLDDSNILEFLQSHTSVLYQPDHDSKGYGGINPYKLGYEIFSDIKRICENPTEEDKFYFPGLIGKNWIEEIKFAAENFKDDSFILQYLSPKVVRDLKLMSIKDGTYKYCTINATHGDEDDFKQIRRHLSNQYDMFQNIPKFYIEGADLRKSRTLFFVLEETYDPKLDEDDEREVFLNGEDFCRVMSGLKTLWPFVFKVKTILKNGEICRNEA